MTEAQYKELIECLLDVIYEVARDFDASAIHDPTTWVGGIYLEGCKVVGRECYEEGNDE